MRFVWWRRKINGIVKSSMNINSSAGSSANDLRKTQTPAEMNSKLIK